MNKEKGKKKTTKKILCIASSDRSGLVPERMRISQISTNVRLLYVFTFSSHVHRVNTVNVQKATFVQANSTTLSNIVR